MFLDILCSFYYSVGRNSIDCGFNMVIDIVQYMVLNEKYFLEQKKKMDRRDQYKSCGINVVYLRNKRCDQEVEFWKEKCEKFLSLKCICFLEIESDCDGEDYIVD